MHLSSKCPISEEKLEKYNSFLNTLDQVIKRSYLPSIYCVLLQSSYELMERDKEFPPGDIGIFSIELLSKFLNEGWAIIGCFERAAYLSCFHHVRSSLELTACYHWVIYKDNKRSKRLTKYLEYKDLYPYQLYLKYKDNKDDLGKTLTEKGKNKLEYWKGKEKEWLNLFKPENDNLLKISNWHYSTKIDHFLDEFPNGDLKMFYEEFSHATHLSPFSHRLGTENSVLGLPVADDGNLNELNRPLIVYLSGLESLLSMIHKHTGFKSDVKFPEK